MSNEAALIVIAAIWLFSGRGLNLCFLIIAYYLTFLIATPYNITSLVQADAETTYGTYAIQCSIDSLMLVSIIYLSTFHHNFTRIYFAYGAIIGTSLLLNGAMLLDQLANLSMIYKAHAIRQEFSIPLDVLFAVLGSAAVERTHINSRLRTGNSSNYNRFNSDSKFM
jgi:hypothetical protein